MILDVLKKYNYGIELETSKKFTSEQRDYIRQKFRGEVVHDGSVDGEEINSPIIPGEEVQVWVNDICKYLASIGMTVNKKCGFHLHISLRFMPSDNIMFFRNLLHNYKYYEPALFAMVPPSRAKGSWCAPVQLSTIEIDKIHNEDSIFKYYYREQRVTKERKDRIRSTNKGTDFRYYNLNLHSWFHRGSIEIRMHSGTVNPEKILNWVYINTAIFEMSLQGEPRTNIRREELSCVISSLRDCMSRLNDGVIRDQVRSYIDRRVEKFSPEIEEDLVGISSKPVSVKMTRRQLKEGSSEWTEMSRTIEFKDLAHMHKELEEYRETYTRKAGVQDEEYVVGSVTIKSDGTKDSGIAIAKAVEDMASPSLCGSYQAV